MRHHFHHWFQWEILFPLIVLLAPVGFWIGRILSVRTIVGRLDNIFYFYPMTAAGMEQWRAGVVPLWTSGIQSGFPLLADGQGALLYPLNFLTYFILPAPLAFNLGIAIQVMLAAVFMFLFVRALGVSRWPAVIAGWVYVFAGAISNNLGSPSLNGLLWWPLLFTLAEHLSRHVNWRLVAATAVIMGLGWLGGFPQTTLFGIVSASAYLLFRSWTNDRAGFRPVLVSVGAWITAALIGIGIGAIQLLPTLEMSTFSVRAGGVDFALASQGSMFPTGFAGFLLPTWDRLGEYGLAGHNLYIGLLGLGGSLLTLRRIQEKRVSFFWGLALLGCFLSLGKYNPIYPFIYHWPGLHFLRVPARFLYWTTFSLAVLCALGFDRILSGPDRAKEIRRLLAFHAALVGTAIAGTVVGGLVLHWKWNALMRMAQEYANRSLLGRAYHLQAQSYYESRIREIFGVISQALNPVDPEIATSIILASIAGTIVFVWSRRPKVHCWAQPALLGILLLDVGLLAAVPIQTAAVDDRSLTRVRSLNGRNGKYRLYEFLTQEDIIREAKPYQYLSPDRNLLFGVDHVGVYSALGSRRYFELMRPLGGINLAYGLPPATEEDVIRSRPLLNLLNAGFVASNKALDVDGFRQEGSGPPFLYRNERALPRAFVVPEAQFSRDAAGIREFMQSSRFDPEAAVFIESQGPAAEIQGARSPVSISVYRDRYISMQAAGPGWLVVTDLDYPGWQVRVDGKDSQIYRGDYVFRALPLTPGDHRIEFVFKSKSFRAGAALSGLSVVMLSIMLIGTKSRPEWGSKNFI